MRRDTASERYQRDPEFKHLVDLIQCEIESLHYSPSELREAVMLATLMYEDRHIRTSYLYDKGNLKFLCAYCGHEAHVAGECTTRVVDAAGDVDECPCRCMGIIQKGRR